MLISTSFTPSPSTPLVSCLCVTRNRRKFIPQMVDCFLSQTYSHKELVIVTDGDPECESVTDLVSGVQGVRLVTLPGHPPTLGEKRNLGVLECHGEIIAHLDDDDWYSPYHVQSQVLHLLSTGAAVAGYQNSYFTDGTHRWIYYGGGHPAVGLGASLVYWKTWAVAYPFPSVQIAEDNAFVWEAFNHTRHADDDPQCINKTLAGHCQERLYSGVSGLGMIVARRHRGNTSQQRMTDLNYIPYEPFPDGV